MDKQTKGDEANKPWVVREVPERTRRRVKLFAVEYDIPMGRALEFLIDTALGDERLVRRRLDTSAMYCKIEGADRADLEWEMIQAGRVVDIEQRIRDGKPVTEEEERLARIWAQANQARIMYMSAYRDEREALEKEQKKKQLAEEPEEPPEEPQE